VLVVFIITAVVVLGGVFLAATGRGGELAPEYPDHAPLDLGSVSAPDIALLRPPTALWGYSTQVTDEALSRIARAMRDRDVTIASLQQQLASRAAQDPSASPVPVAPAPLAPMAPMAPQPTEVTQPAEATQPAALPPSSYDVPGPQGSYDAHGWWAQQEEAEREEALRQAQARAGAQAEASSGEPAPPDAAGHPATPPADRDDTEPGRTSTQPNPTVASPAGDDALAVAEEQGW
jgi:hypothetical protein